MANEASQALENSFALNKLFSESFAPINNFVAQQTQLSIAKQRDLEARTRALQDMQTRFEQEKALESAKDAAFLQRTQTEQAGASERNASSIAAATGNIKLANQLHEQEQIDAENRQRAAILRADPDTKRILNTSKFPATPEGDAALVAAYSKAYTPEVAENLSTDTLVGLNGEISRLLQDLGNASTDPAQEKNAVLKFFADPTVSAALIKKGNLTQQEINDLSNSGDLAKVSKVVDDTARRSGWWGRDDKLLSTMVGALAQARVAATGGDPDQLARADTLKSLLTKRDSLLQKGLINSPEAWKRIHESMAIPQKTSIKLPPPPVPSGLAGRPPDTGAENTDTNGILGPMAKSAAASFLLPPLAAPMNLAGNPEYLSSLIGTNPLQKSVTQDELMRFLPQLLFGHSASQFDSAQPGIFPGRPTSYVPGTVPQVQVPPDNGVRLNF